MPFLYNPPGSKSLTNRTLILRALSGSKTRVKNLPESDDVRVMQNALKNIREGKTSINVGNSGTASRFLCAAITIMQKKITIDGIEAMRKRPIAELITALINLGAKIIYLGKNGYLPIQITPKKMHGGVIKIPMEKSSQYASSLALIGPFLPGGLTLKITGKRRSESYFQMTLKLLKQWGVRIEQKNSSKIVIYEGIKPLKEYIIEADMASSSYFHSLAKLHHKKLRFPKRGIQAEQEFFTILKNFETLKTIDAKNIPDTTLTLAVLAPLLGKSITFTNVNHLQYKESNRLSTLSKELRKIGAKVKTTKNSINITGPRTIIPDAVIETHGDHRIAMAFSLVKSLYPQTTIKNPEVVQKSYPKFWKDFATFHLSLNKNIVLIGMPGSGKTTLGKALAKKWKYQFLDLDDFFEKEYKTTISKFVSTYGWPAFRKNESRLLKNIRPGSRMMIATGGGIIENPESRKKIKKLGNVIYIEHSITTLIEHLKNSKKRPHLEEHKKTTLKELESIRLPLYKEAAHITLTGDNIQKKIKLLEQQLFYHVH